MSAYIVDKSHIDALISMAFQVARHDRSDFSWYHEKKRHVLTAANAGEVGQMLVKENVQGVSYRYGDTKLTELPGPNDAYWVLPYMPLPYKTRNVPITRFEPVAILKAINGYTYQACEDPEWEKSEAYAFCEALKSSAITMLPGYEEAQWEITPAEARHG